MARNTKPLQVKKLAKLNNNSITFTEIDSYVGRVCLEFNNLEGVIFSLVQNLLKTHPVPATAIWSLMQWNQRLELLNKLMNFVEEYSSYWKDLYSFLQEIAGDRNFIVHSQTRSTKTQDVEVYTLKENYFPTDYGLARRVEDLDIPEITNIILDIHAATVSIINLNNSMFMREPSLEALNSLGIRWREKNQNTEVVTEKMSFDGINYFVRKKKIRKK